MKVWTDEHGVNVSWNRAPQHLRSLYLWRVTNYVALAVECALLALEVFVFRTASGAVPVVFAIVVMLWAIRRNARRIAAARRELRRPDYSRIASLEREIYGETFRHDGASGPLTSRQVAVARCESRIFGMTLAGYKRAKVYGPGEARSGTCGVCGYRLRAGDFGHCAPCNDLDRRERRREPPRGGAGTSTSVWFTSGGVVAHGGGGGGAGTTSVRCARCEHPLSQCGCTPWLDDGQP